jgi:beta-1,4-N-acetylglucosaminyltransferase
MDKQVLTSFFDVSALSDISVKQQFVLLVLFSTFILLNLVFFRLASVLSRSRDEASFRPRPPPSQSRPTHLLVVLGSGGHTAEMLNILGQIHWLQIHYTYRTYVVSSGDNFSASKVQEFESTLLKELESSKRPIPEQARSSYDVVTVHRARNVHQPLYTTPVSSLRCLWNCVNVLRGTHQDFQRARREESRMYPDLILTNGPGTGVIVILASILLLFFGFCGPVESSKSPSPVEAHQDKAAPETAPPTYPQGQMRSIYIESWARVKALSLSGRLLKPFVDRFLVQWPEIAKKEGERVEYLGPLVI